MASVEPYWKTHPESLPWKVGGWVVLKAKYSPKGFPEAGFEVVAANSTNGTVTARRGGQVLNRYYRHFFGYVGEGGDRFDGVG